MSEQQPEDDSKVKYARRLFAFLGILLVIVGQIFVYTWPVLNEAMMPTPFGSVIVGVVLFVWSQVYRPSPAIQTFFARFRFSGPAPWIIISLTLSLLAVLTMLLFANYGRT